MKFSPLALLLSALLISSPAARSAPPVAKQEKPAAKAESPAAKPDAKGGKELVLFNGGDSIDDWEARDAGGSRVGGTSGTSLGQDGAGASALEDRARRAGRTRPSRASDSQLDELVG